MIERGKGILISTGEVSNLSLRFDDYLARLDQARAELRAMIATAIGKPIAPQMIFFISDLPKTRSGKIMRRMTRSAYLRLDLGDTSALLNRKVLEEIKGITIQT